jgi:hypothetical protein
MLLDSPWEISWPHFLAWRIRGGAINVAIMNKTELPQETIWRPFLYGNALRFSATMKKALLFAAILALTLGMQTPIVIVNGAPTEDVPADAAFDPMTGILYQGQGATWDEGKSLGGPASNTVRSPLTVQQIASRTIPKITAGGPDANIPLAIRPKGNSGFLQLGPDTLGASGWSGYDLGTEYIKLNTTATVSYGYYSSITSGDYTNASLIGDSISLYTKNDAVNNTDQLIGLDVNAYPQLPTGKTLRQAVGAQAQVEAFNSGTITTAYGLEGFVTARQLNHIDVACAINGAVSAAPLESGSIDFALSHQSVLGNLSTVSGAGTGIHFYSRAVNTVPMEELITLYSEDLTGRATNTEFLRLDSPGVFIVNGAGMTQYYNPSFSPKYTPGATSFERAVQQWNGNVLEYGTEAGSTGGALRGVRIIGDSLEVGSGLLKLTPRAEPSSPVEGMIYANSSDHHLYFYNGTTWKQLDN